MDIYEEIELHECPYCGGAGLLDDGNGWCWTAARRQESSPSKEKRTELTQPGRQLISGTSAR